MLVTDIDGPLLDDGGRLRRSNREALGPRIERGVHVTLATGRTLAAARELAARMGATALDPRDGVVEYVREKTSGLGVDVGLEMAGHPEAIRQGLAALKKGGEMVLLGLPAEPVSLDLGEGVIFREITLRGINGRRMFQTWYQAEALLRGGLDVQPVITHRFPMERYQEAFALMASGQCGKVVLIPPQP